MADIDILEQKIDKLTEFVGATHVSDEPIYQGTATQLTPVLSKMGKFIPTTKEIDVPGWLDDLARAFKAGSTVLFRQNRKGEVVPARWYEYLEDGSTDMVFGAYIYPVLTGANALITSGERGRVRARNTIDSIRKEYPTSSISTSEFAEKMFKAEMENAAEIAKEKAKWTPVKLEFEKNGKKGYISVIPASTLSYPFFDINQFGGKREEVPAPYVPHIDRKYGGMPAPYKNPGIAAGPIPNLEEIRKYFQKGG